MSKQGLIQTSVANTDMEDPNDSDYSSDDKKRQSRKRQRVNSLRSDKMRDKILNNDSEIHQMEKTVVAHLNRQV